MSIRIASLCAVLLGLSACAGTAPDYAAVDQIPGMTPRIGVFAVDSIKDGQFLLHYQLSAGEWTAMRALSGAATSVAPGSFLVWRDPREHDPLGHPTVLLHVLAEIPDSGGCRAVEWAFLHGVTDDRALVAALDGEHAGTAWMASLARQHSTGGYYTENFIVVCPTKAGASVYSFRHSTDYFFRTDPATWVSVGDFEADPAWITAATKAGYLIVKQAAVPAASAWGGPVPEPAVHKQERLAAKS